MLIRSLLALILVALATPAEAGRRRGGGGGGHYRSGHGSSHRGGSYKNKKTGDHYRTR